MLCQLICIECRTKGENQGILEKIKVKIRMEQGRGIVGGIKEKIKEFWKRLRSKLELDKGEGL